MKKVYLEYTLETQTIWCNIHFDKICVLFGIISFLPKVVM